jgi:hypothetical protein
MNRFLEEVDFVLDLTHPDINVLSLSRHPYLVVFLFWGNLRIKTPLLGGELASSSIHYSPAINHYPLSPYQTKSSKLCRLLVLTMMQF